jgi:hypothetical protein
MAIAFNKRGGEHSRNTNVGRCIIGSIETKVVKNICKLLSKNLGVRSVNAIGVVMPARVLLSCALRV